MKRRRASKKSRPTAEPKVGLATRPRVFIGSAGDKLEVAGLAKHALSATCDADLWTESIVPNGILLGRIVSLVQSYDAGLFIFSASDLTASKGSLFESVRDNVVFEIGVFMGGLGVDRTFLLAPAVEEIKIPSDINGLLMATYGEPSRESIAGALGPIKQAIGELGPSVKSSYNELRELKFNIETREIYVDEDEATFNLGSVVRIGVESRAEPWYPGTHPRSLMDPISAKCTDDATDECYWELVVQGVFRFLNTEHFTHRSWHWEDSIDCVALSARGVALLNLLRLESHPRRVAR